MEAKALLPNSATSTAHIAEKFSLWSRMTTFPSKIYIGKHKRFKFITLEQLRWDQPSLCSVSYSTWDVLVPLKKKNPLKQYF